MADKSEEVVQKLSLKFNLSNLRELIDLYERDIISKLNDGIVTTGNPVKGEINKLTIKATKAKIISAIDSDDIIVFLTNMYFFQGICFAYGIYGLPELTCQMRGCFNIDEEEEKDEESDSSKADTNEGSVDWTIDVSDN